MALNGCDHYGCEECLVCKGVGYCFGNPKIRCTACAGAGVVRKTGAGRCVERIAAELSKAELQDIVAQIQSILYVEIAQGAGVLPAFLGWREGEPFFAPGKVWTPETIDGIAEVLNAHGLVPTRIQAVREIVQEER